MNAELLVDALHVGLHGVLGNEQTLAYSGHRVALGEQKKDIALPRREAVTLGQHGTPLAESLLWRDRQVRTLFRHRGTWCTRTIAEQDDGGQKQQVHRHEGNGRQRKVALAQRLGVDPPHQRSGKLGGAGR